MATVDVTMVNNDNSKQFLFRGVRPFKRKKSQPVIDVAFINTTPANTFLFRFFGQSEMADFEFALFDDGVDVANGTHTSTVVTVAQQIQYLFDSFFTDNYDVDWTLTQSTFFASSITGVITDIEVDPQNGAASIVTFGRLTFKRGRIGSL